MGKEHITMIGAGLAGPVMASYLAELGYSIEIHEKRHDMRLVEQSAGRSINLALSKRGINALKDIGVFEKIKPMMMPMVGRMIHESDGNIHLQKYGQKSSEVIYSISRAFLNKTLMDHAETKGEVDITFSHPVEKVDLQNSKIKFNDGFLSFSRLLGSDGSSSAIRDAINQISSINFRKVPLDHGYKELTIPPDSSGNFRMDSNALHIWPRGGFMLIALPNMDKSFTCTLFFPLDGKVSFSSLKSYEDIKIFFDSYFPDTVDLMPDLIDEYNSNPIGKLATVYCDRFHFADKALIFGDAAHAIVPFFGQGMNASFQDCTVIDSLIKRYNGSWNDVFSEFSNIHVPNGHAIANMALENYIEMRDSVNNPIFKKRREIEFQLEKKFSNRFIPRYSMVSFHDLPYSKVYMRGETQLKLIDGYLSKRLSRDQLYESIMNDLSPIESG